MAARLEKFFIDYLCRVIVVYISYKQTDHSRRVQFGAQCQIHFFPKYCIDPRNIYDGGGGGGDQNSLSYEVVKAFAHGVMGRRIDPSWWTH